MEKELKELVHLVKDSKESAAAEAQIDSKNISDVETDSTNASKAEELEVGSPRLKVGASGKSILYRSRTSSSAHGNHEDEVSSTSEDKLFLHPPKEVVKWLAKAFENAAKERKGKNSHKSKLSSVSKSLQPHGDTAASKDSSFMPTGPSSLVHDGDPLAHVTKVRATRQDREDGLIFVSQALLKDNSKKERAAERLESKSKKINSPSLAKASSSSFFLNFSDM
eukprot:764025-Hanusia_phi.AAC.4